MPMSSEVDVEIEMKETAEEAVSMDGPFVPTLGRTNINDVNEFGDVEYYLWEMYYIEGKEPTTLEGPCSAVSAFERFIEQSNRFDCSVDNAGRRVAKGFRRWIVGQVEASTAAKYINSIDNMAQFYLSDGYYEGNPFEDLADGVGTSDSDRSASYQSNDRISVDDSKLREAIRSTHGSSLIVLLAILVKTGIRISEACNLDWEDINLDHPLADDLLPDPRFKISDEPDTMFIDSSKTEETTDAYTGGNKRRVDSEIPIDDELKRLLLWYALTREQRFDDENPILMVSDQPVDCSSDRLGTSTAYNRVRNLAEEYGWHGSQDEMKNVTPHWFRSKGTTHLANQIEAIDDSSMDDAEAIVKGIRGDVGDDVIETYRLREESFKNTIRSCMFKIGLEGV